MRERSNNCRFFLTQFQPWLPTAPSNHLLLEDSSAVAGGYFVFAAIVLEPQFHLYHVISCSTSSSHSETQDHPMPRFPIFCNSHFLCFEQSTIYV